MVKCVNEDLDLFYDPLSGERQLPYQYILIGDENDISTPSAALIDLSIEFERFRENVANTHFIVQSPNDIVPDAQALNELIPGMLRHDNGVVSIQTLTHDKIWVGNIDNYPEESDIIPFTALPDLTYQYLWRGDALNRPEEIKRIDLYNAPAFLNLDPTKNFGLNNLYAGGLQLDPLEPIAPSTTMRLDMSNLPNVTKGKMLIGKINYTPPIITIDGIPPYVHVVGDLNWDPLGAIMNSHAVLQEIGLDRGRVFIGKSDNSGEIVDGGLNPGEIFWGDPLNNGGIVPTGLLQDQIFTGDNTGKIVKLTFNPGTLLYCDETDSLIAEGLQLNEIFVGDSLGRAMKKIILDIANMANLTHDKIWVGNVSNRPVEGNLPQAALPDLQNDYIWIGDGFNRPNPELTIQILNLPGLANKRIWTGDVTNRPIETTILDIDNMANLTSGKMWQGDLFNRPVEVDINFAPDDATYVIRTSNASLPNAHVTSLVGVGITKLVANGFFSIAVPTEDYATPAQITNLQNQINSINSQISSINSQISAINTHLSTIDGEIATIQGEIATLQGEVAALQAEVIALQAEIAGILTAIAAIEGQLLDPVNFPSTLGLIAIGAAAAAASALGLIATIEAQLNTPVIGIGPRLDYLEGNLLGLANLANAGDTGIVVVTGGSTYATRTLLEGNAITITNDDGVGGDITIAISNNPVIPGDSGLTLPTGSTLDRSGPQGTVRFNTNFNVFEGTPNGTDWVTFNTYAFGTVTSVGISGGTGGLTISGSPVTSAGTIDLQLDYDLVALGALTGGGFPARVGDANWILRTFNAGTGINVANSDGFGGNPVISLSNTAVTPGSYVSANITVDAQGRLTAASNGAGGGTVTNIATGTGLTGGPITTTGTISLADTGVTAGPYTWINGTVNAQGQFTAISSNASPVLIVAGTTNEIDVTGTTNVVVGLSDNAILPGVEGVTVPSGTTAQRPGSPNIGEIRFNTTLGRLEVYY